MKNGKIVRFCRHRTYGSEGVDLHDCEYVGVVDALLDMAYQGAVRQMDQTLNKNSRKYRDALERAFHNEMRTLRLVHGLSVV